MKRAILALIVAVAGCDVSGLDDDVTDRLKEERRAFIQQGIDDYSYEYFRQCFCWPMDTLVITVRNNAVTSAVGKHTGAPARAGDALTIPQLYDYLIDVAEDADDFDVEFDTRIHIPTRVEADPDRNTIDEEFALWLGNFAAVISR